MRRFKPLHGVVLVVSFIGLVLLAELALDGRLGAAAYERVRPAPNGEVRISLAGLAPLRVRFYRFLNSGNQEVKFFVGREPGGDVEVAFDADETCAKAKRGFRHEGEWMVCNKCDKSFRLSETNAGGGGCRPIPLEHRVEGDQLVLAEADVLKGWRLFH
ncbi:MAG TPA: Fe-S-containing protein [Dongiaceae bacterium]